MRHTAMIAAAVVLTAGMGVYGSCSAAEPGHPAGSGGIAGLLAGKAVPTSELGALRAGSTDIKTTVLKSTASNYGGTSGGSSSITDNSNSTIGTIAASDSINNNTGITTVFMNSGANSVFQNSTTITINMH